jgi:hypothetical protein
MSCFTKDTAACSLLQACGFQQKDLLWVDVHLYTHTLSCCCMESGCQWGVIQMHTLQYTVVGKPCGQEQTSCLSNSCRAITRFTPLEWLLNL